MREEKVDPDLATSPGSTDTEADLANLTADTEVTTTRNTESTTGTIPQEEMTGRRGSHQSRRREPMEREGDRPLRREEQ